jgi:hypothetical protein
MAPVAIENAGAQSFSGASAIKIYKTDFRLKQRPR